MPLSSSRTRLLFVIGISLVAAGAVYAATALELFVGTSDHIGLWNGPARLTARTLKTPVGETTGGLRRIRRLAVKTDHWTGEMRQTRCD